MLNHSRLAKLSLLALFLVACNSFPVSSPPTPTDLGLMQTPTATAAPVNTTPIPTTTAPSATPPETAIGETPTPLPKPCEVVAESEVTVYQRPSSDAMVFGSMPAGVRVVAQGRTADGWLGFDPGVAQAANIGIFRLRWVDGSSGVSLEGTCEGLPELMGPPARICFFMPMDEVQVYAEPDISSEIIAAMVVDDYAAVLGKTTEEWAKVDLGLGNTGLDLTGWIQGVTLNLNGLCDNLPTIEP